VTYLNNKQTVVTGLKDMVIFVVIFNTCITWMIVRSAPSLTVIDHTYNASILTRKKEATGSPAFG